MVFLIKIRARLSQSHLQINDCQWLQCLWDVTHLPWILFALSNSEVFLIIIFALFRQGSWNTFERGVFVQLYKKCKCFQCFLRKVSVLAHWVLKIKKYPKIPQFLNKKNYRGKFVAVSLEKMHWTKIDSGMFLLNF